MRPSLVFLSRMGDWFSTDKLLALSKKKVLCLFYHTANDSVPDHIKHLYTPRTKQQFLDDLDFLSAKFDFISSAQLLSQSFPASKPCIHLSFDDGLTGCYDFIAPALKERHIPATFFINPAFVGNKEMFYCHKGSILKEAYLKNPVALKDENENVLTRPVFFERITSIYKGSDDFYDTIATQLQVNFEDYLLQQKPYMSLSEIQKLANDGFDIGGHTLTHPLLNQITDDKKLEQIINSVNWIDKKQLAARKYFSFPFHDIGIQKNIFDSMHHTGAIAISFGSSDMKEDSIPNHYQRISFENSVSSAEKLLKRQLFKFFLLKVIGKNVIRRN